MEFRKRFGPFLYFSLYETNDKGDCFWRFENDFAYVIIDLKDHEYYIKVGASKRAAKEFKELIKIKKYGHYRIELEKAKEIIQTLVEISISINGIERYYHDVGPAPFKSLKEQYLRFHYLILMSPERILVKLREYIVKKDIKYRCWHRWFNINYFEK